MNLQLEHAIIVLGTETLEMGIAQFGEYETTTVQYVGKNGRLCNMQDKYYGRK